MNPFLRLCATIAVAAAIHAGSFSALPASEGGASHGAEPAAGSHADGNTGEATGAHGSGATGASGGHGDTAEGAADGEQHVSKRELAYDVLPDGSDQPWRLVRNLQVLQDGIVAGEQSKLDEYRYEINRVGRILGNAGSAVWQVQRNLDAAAMLLLFGGDAAVGRHALAATRLGELDTAPLKAALDYRENNFRAASEYFLYYDVSRLPPSMRGQFTFIAGIIFGNSNAETAEKLFDRAALLSTGTLVEEASLRRLIAIAGKNHDADKLSMVARQYTQRFSRSPYYGDFVRNFYTAAIMMPEEEFAKVEEKLQFVVDQLAAEKRLEIMSSIAQKAVGLGRLKLASWAAGGALPLARENSAREQRLRLYLAAAKLPEADTFEEGRKLLAAVQRDRLNQEHRQLFDALTYLVKGLTALPLALPPEESVRQGSQTKPDAAGYPEMARDTLQKRDALMAEIQKLENQ